MDMTEGVAVVRNRVADAALVDLHMIYIIQQLEARAADQANDLGAHLGGREEVADMVGGDVQSLEIEVDLLLLCKLCTGEQGVIHRAQLDRVGTDVQNKVNELLNKNVPTPSKPLNTGVTKVVAGSGAASFNKSLAGSYVTTTGLYMRHGAGKNKRAMVLIPEGTKVQNYGYYTSYNGTKWLYIQVTLNGVQYTGFSSKTYLKKQ